MLELQDLHDFSIHEWYEKFKNICMETTLIEIPFSLLEKFRSNDFEIDVVEVCGTDYLDTLKNAINKFNKKVFVKNNWHAPLDAKMFSIGNMLKVTNVNDLLLYISASTVMCEDFSCQHNGIPFYLALKPWKNIHPASEFRCIVINNVLIGITPRDWPTYYAHFKEEGPTIIHKLNNFFKENIATVFRRRHYTFDVILSFPDDISIIDFGLLSNRSCLYAFTWKEISPLLNKDIPEEVPPVFRYLEADMGIMKRTDALFKFANSLS